MNLNSMRYLSNKSMVGQHYYKVFENGNVLHVNHMNNGNCLINMIEDKDLDVMEHPEKYPIFDFEPQTMEKITEKDFVTALRVAIFELGLFEYVESK